MSDIPTPERVSQYIADGGSACPFCGSANIFADESPEVSEAGAYQEIECSACHRKWIDCYHLAALMSTEGEPWPEALEETT